MWDRKIDPVIQCDSIGGCSRIKMQFLSHGWFLNMSPNLPFLPRPGKPTCRCPVGFSGPFCERRICDNYCLNGGTCDITQGNQPVCRCMAEYTGERCLYRESRTYCTVEPDYAGHELLLK